MPITNIPEEELTKILVLRSMGYHQNEIAERLGIRQQRVSIAGRILRERAEEMGPEKLMLEMIPNAIRQSINAIIK